MADVYNILSSVLIKIFIFMVGYICKLCMIGGHKKPPSSQMIYDTSDSNYRWIVTIS